MEVRSDYDLVLVVTEQFLTKLAETRPKAAQTLRERGVRTCRSRRDPRYVPLEFDFDLWGEEKAAQWVSREPPVPTGTSEPQSKNLIDHLIDCFVNLESGPRNRQIEYLEFVTVPELLDCEFDHQVYSTKAALLLKGSLEDWGLSGKGNYSHVTGSTFGCDPGRQVCDPPI